MLHRLLPVAALATALLVSGCTSLHVSRTVSLKGLPPIADTKRITVIDQNSEAPRPYQIIGKVTVYREGTRITKNATTERIRESAGPIGADGIIDLHRNNGGGLYSALAVKWLEAGEVAKPRELPFTIALLPIVIADKVPGNRAKMSEALHQRGTLVYLLDAKGYYLMPSVPTDFTGGIEAAMKLDDAALQALGGKDTDLLMEVAILDAKRKYGLNISPVLIGIGASTNAMIRTTIMDKATRKILLQKDTEGETGSTGILWTNLIASDEKRINAAWLGVQAALKDLKPIHDASSY